MLANGPDSHAKPLRFLDLGFGESGSQSIEFRKLPLITLETTEQQTAVNQLVPKGKYIGLTSEFQDHVLRLLGLIADKMRGDEKAGLTSRKSRETARKIRRLAERAHTFAGVLETYFGYPTPNLPLAPSNDLRQYAQELERCADSIQLGRIGLIPELLATQKREKRPPRRTRKIGNELIVVLADLVRKVTGEDHYDELTVLLRYVTGDKCYKNHRLQVLLWEYKQTKKKWGRIATTFALNRII